MGQSENSLVIEAPKRETYKAAVGNIVVEFSEYSRIFRVGSKVKTDFHEREAHIIREVIAVRNSEKMNCQSGVLVSLDGGNGGRALQGLDSDWIREVVEY